MASRPLKKRKLTPPESEDEDNSRRSSAKIQKAFFSNAAGWDLENDYEAKARKTKNKKDKEPNRLPIKTADGRLLQVEAPASGLTEVESDEEWLKGDEASLEDSDEGDAEEDEQEQPTIPEAQQIREAKEELAKIASQLSENPEEHAGAFKALAKVGETKIVAIQKLALVTQLSVYKDVIPGYRIRPAGEEVPGEKISKEVRSLRGYEQSLVMGYQNYIKELAKHAKAGRNQTAPTSRGQTIANIAITCTCTLLNAVPHFNFRGELLKILAGKLSTRSVDADFNKCLRAIETFFQEDEEGRPSMEAVALLSRMMKARDYRVDESVLNLFLYLRLLSEFSGKASHDRVDFGKGVGPNGKKMKQKKEFRTKKERKQMKEQKALQKDMDQADALVSHEERDRMQSETLKLVFASYFRILKARVPSLMGAVLEGLAKYAHLINQDFFGDLLEALKDLIRHSYEDLEEDQEGGGEEEKDILPDRNTTREALLCTVTAFALLAGQDAHNAKADLHLDLSFFTTNLYQTLLPLSLHPDLELGARSLHLPDPDSNISHIPSTSRNKINLHTTTVLLIRSLTAVLLPPWHIRSTPPLRLAAFTKQLMTASLHTPEKSTQAILALLADIGSTHGKKVASLWNTEERKGDGTFNALSESVEGSNPFAATVWEGELLRRHYCPKVRNGVKAMEKSLAEANK
jgi:nucleolar complex protein 3